MIEKELDLCGQQLSNYKVVGKLGRGGMATVYKAHELSLNRMVALKVLSPRLSEDTEFIKRFQREAQAAAKLNHPNIVQIYAIGEDQGIHYFAMEYIKGEPLSDIKKQKGRLSAAEAVPVIKQVAEALGQAHLAGLIHRDVKPSNIMIDKTGRAKVTDFGIAHVIEAETKLTREGSIIGTPEYLSPEQCEGKTVDGRSDIYSLGVTLYELLSGKTPYLADTPVSMLMKIVQGDFRPLEEVNPDVPKPVIQIVAKMMKTSPEERYANTDELIAALDTVDSQPVSPPTVAPTIPRQQPLAKNTEAEPATMPIEQHFQAEPQKQSGSWKGVLIAFIVVAVLGGILAAKIFYFDKQGTKKDEVTKQETAATTEKATEKAVSQRDADSTGPDSSTSQPSDSTATADASSPDSTDTAGSGQPGDNESSGTATAPVEAGSGESVAGQMADPQGTGANTGTEAVSDSGSTSSQTSSANVSGDIESSPDTGTQAGQPVEKSVSQNTASPDTSGTSKSPVSTDRAVSKTKGKTGMSGDISTPPRSSSHVSGTAGTTGTVKKRIPKVVSKPPAKSLAFIPLGNIEGGDIAISYFEEIFSNQGYTIIDDPGAGQRARYHIKIKTRSLSSRQLEYGRSDTLKKIGLTVKIIAGDSGAVIGSFTETVEYTALNMEENLKEAVQTLAGKIKARLE